MLSWCSYCQKFIREVPPYDSLVLTHGLCAACEPSVFALTGSDIEHARTLRDIQDRLSDAGRSNDFAAVARIIDDASKANVRGVDILIGVIAPMLYQIGEDWRRGVVSYPQELRFTAFCEKVCEMVDAQVLSTTPDDAARAERVEALLINAPGNCHVLGIRILALWLAHQGIMAKAVTDPLTIDAAVTLVTRTRPRTLMISMALAEEVTAVATIAERVAALPDDVRPRVIVGGNAVKQGLVQEIPGAELVADISTLVMRPPPATRKA